MFDEYLERFISTNDPLLVALLGLSMCLTIGWAVTFYGYRRLRQTLKHQQKIQVFRENARARAYACMYLRFHEQLK